jgi:GT2 family glycosyltransferase
VSDKIGNLNLNLDLTISIVSGSQPALTMGCLKSLIDSLDNTLAVEIFLVDNASPDNIGEQCHREFPQIKVLRNQTRKGFAANQNQVLSIGHGRYFLILNDDTIVGPAAPKRLVEIADQHPSFGFFGPRLINPNGSLQRSAFRFPSPGLVLSQAFLLHRFLNFLPIFDDYRGWKHSDMRSVEFLSGAALMVRKEVIEQIGLLDEGFFMYCEETDWCMRGRKAGWRVLFIPESEITHFGAQSTIDLRPERSVEFWRSHEYYLKKHHGKLGCIAYKLSMLIKHLPRLAVAKLCGSERDQADHIDIVLWALGQLKRPGLAETVTRTT